MNTETQKTEKALAALDTMATIWAAQTNLPRLVRAVLAAPADMRQEMLTALVKQAHVEGLYEGRTSHDSAPRQPANGPSEPEQIDLYTGESSKKPAACWSADNEEFAYDTLGELIDNSDDLVVGDIVYAADAVTPDPATYIDANDILTQMGERASDDCGEYASDYPDVDGAAKQELEDFLNGWARKHCTPTNFYSVQNVREHVLTAEDLEQS